MDAVSIRVPYKNLKQEVELVDADDWEHRRASQIHSSSSPPGSSDAGVSPQDTDRHNPPQDNCSLLTLILSCTVAAGVQFGWALQLSLLTPYVQTLGIGHEFSSFIWLCGPITGLVVQPCVGIWSDKCSSKYGRRRPFILVGSLMISVAVIIIGYSADIGYMLGDTKEHCSTFKGTRTRAAFVFVIGFWMLDLANNTVQGPARALLADLSDEQLEPLSWELRVQIALDVARGLEYLHDGIKNLLPQLPHQPQLLQTVCLVIGSYSKWLDAAPSGTSFLWLLINILVSGMSVSEDTAAAEDSLHLVEALSMVISYHITSFRPC